MNIVVLVEVYDQHFLFHWDKRGCIISKIYLSCVFIAVVSVVCMILSCADMSWEVRIHFVFLYFINVMLPVNNLASSRVVWVQ